MQTTWKYLGPGGADVVDIALAPSDPRLLYLVSARRTLYRSADRGSTWQTLGERVPLRYDWHGLLIDTTMPETLYLLKDDVLIKSTDRGRVWQRVLGEGLATLESISCMTLDPASKHTLYAGADGEVLKSTDGGESWSRSGLGIEEYVGAMAVNPVDTHVVYAGVGDGYVMRSTNGGARWKLAGRLPGRRSMNDLRVAAASPDTLYAAADNGVFKSTDAGRRWAHVTTGLRYLEHLAIDPSDAEVVYAVGWGGAFVTHNGGKAWRPVAGISDYGVARLVIDPSDPATVYAGTTAGVLRSTDRGATWNMSNSGMRECAVGAIGVDPFKPNTVYVGAPAGILKSIDGGATWSFSSDEGRKLTHVLQFAMDPKTPNTLYALWTNGEAYKSSDAGASWLAIGERLRFGALAIDTGAPSTIYGAAEGGIYKSSNGGMDWTRCSLGGWGRYDALLVDPGHHSTLYAGCNNGPMLRSPDGGSTWEILPIGRNDTYWRWHVAVDPGTPHTIYVAESAGVDDGIDLAPRAPGPWNSLDPPEARFVGSEDPCLTDLPNEPIGGHWRSTDRGLTWAELPHRYYTTSLLVPPGTSRSLYAGFSGRGVYRSSDGGRTWRAMNQGLTWPPEREVNAMAASARLPNILYVATEAGVFRARVME